MRTHMVVRASPRAGAFRAKNSVGGGRFAVSGSEQGVVLGFPAHIHRGRALEMFGVPRDDS